jgi:hypothetical protein
MTLPSTPLTFPLTVTLSPPLAVGRRSGYYWFPTLLRLADGALLVTAYDDLDAYSGDPLGLYTWSEDEGATWMDPLRTRAPFSECVVLLESGDHLLLPYRLFPEADGVTMWGNASLVSLGRREIIPQAHVVRVEGLPYPAQPQGDASRGEVVTAGFSFNGQTILLTNAGDTLDAGGKRYLTTLYGRFRGEERYSLLFAASRDGREWSVRSILSGKACSLPGDEGPCEAALARLKDGRLICVFRTDGNIANVYDPASETSATPYRVVYSGDNGFSWTEPGPLSRPTRYGTTEPARRLPGSVQPSLAVLAEGTLVLSGGRPGLYLWLSPDGVGSEWIEVDLQSHHNHHAPPGESIDSLINTFSYTEVAPLPDAENQSTLLIAYDRLPLGWRPIPSDSSEQCSVWIVRATLSWRRQ